MMSKMGDYKGPSGDDKVRIILIIDAYFYFVKVFVNKL